MVLKRELDRVAEVTVVAPDRPRSACGHSITLHKPLRMNPAQLEDGSQGWSSSGTPTDCVTLGLLEVLKDQQVDLVFSGINHGPNLGWDLTYSGTVSAAMEGVILGVPAVAISLAWRFRRLGEEDDIPPPPLDFGPAAEYAAELALHLQKNPLPEHTLLNVNVPPRSPLGAQITRQGVRRYPAKLEKRIDPMGRAYYWLGGDDPVDRRDEGTDVHAIDSGYISVTPVQLDLTDHQLVERYSRDSFPGTG